MSDSFMHNHQSALDSQRENDAIQYLEDTGVQPDPKDCMDIKVGDLEPTEFSDGAYRVHYDCLTEQEKKLLEENQ